MERRIGTTQRRESRGVERSLYVLDGALPFFLQTRKDCCLQAFTRDTASSTVSASDNCPRAAGGREKSPPARPCCRTHCCSGGTVPLRVHGDLPRPLVRTPESEEWQQPNSSLEEWGKFSDVVHGISHSLSFPVWLTKPSL